MILLAANQSGKTPDFGAGNPQFSLNSQSRRKYILNRRCGIRVKNQIRLSCEPCLIRDVESRIYLIFLLLACIPADCQYSDQHTQAKYDPQSLIWVVVYGAIRRLCAGQGALFHFGDSSFEHFFSVSHDGLDVVQKFFEVDSVAVSALSHSLSFPFPTEEGMGCSTLGRVGETSISIVLGNVTMAKYHAGSTRNLMRIYFAVSATDAAFGASKTGRRAASE
jgi:hypothetical protein